MTPLGGNLIIELDSASGISIRRAATVREPKFRTPHQRTGFSLIELLIVIVLTSILAKLAISSATPTLYDQLMSTANIVSGELSYARSLAVGNNGSYRFDIDPTGNRLVMRYTGSDPSLNTLPASPFRSPTDPSDQYIVALAKLPRLGMPISLLGAQTSGSSTQTITAVEFGPYGNTTQTNPSLVWLMGGVGTGRRYVPVTVNPVTGLASVGAFTATAPSGFTIPTP